MAKRAEDGRAARSPLTRERVLRAAVALADERGLDAVTMRGLGQALGVEAMSLYHHVRNKEDLLSGVIDEVVAEYQIPSGTDWKAAVRASSLSARDALMRHPWAGSLMLGSISPGPARLHQMDRLLACFRGAGFSVELAHHALHAVDGHVMGFAIGQATFPIAAEDMEQVLAAFLRELDADVYPYLAEHIRYHRDESGMSDAADFEFGLDLILDGLDRMGRSGQRSRR